MTMPTPLVPTVEPELLPLLQLGLVSAAPVVIGAPHAGLAGEVREQCARLRARYRGLEPALIPELRPARELYHAFGIDPTRTRPSSEALLRRVLKDKPFPVVNNAVDWCNLAAMCSSLPLGLYDADKIAGAVALRRGRAGESYPGIRKDDVHLEGRPTLADSHGPFGNPTSDSLRTAVTETTSRLYLVIFAPRSYPRTDLARDTEWIARGFERHCSGGAAQPVATWRLGPGGVVPS
ncbi:MAG: hypothetical protein HY903_02660 [Deltaproteobacteria bacterium]|nr:hypothetical protein [Deltaproteobacteria bacterium]